MAKVKSTDWANVAILVFSVAVITLAVFWSSKEGSGVVPPIEYLNSDIQISFDYPANFVISEETVSPSIYVINLYPQDQGITSNEVISVTDMTVDVSESVEQAAADYLEVAANKIVKVNRDDPSEARYVAYSSTGEVSYYNFFKSDSKLDIVRFNQRVFDQTNPLILKDNSYYNIAYIALLNSMKFSADE